jgi:hypothetical protein
LNAITFRRDHHDFASALPFVDYDFKFVSKLPSPSFQTINPVTFPPFITYAFVRFTDLSLTGIVNTAFARDQPANSVSSSSKADRSLTIYVLSGCAKVVMSCAPLAVCDLWGSEVRADKGSRAPSFGGVRARVVRHPMNHPEYKDN